MTSSADSPRSNSTTLREGAIVATALSLLIACAVFWSFHYGYILYYGDAQSHLNLSRSILDSRTPGYDQLGSVWLPILHVICLPFVWNSTLWSTGLAGAIPVAVCFVIAGLFFYFAAKHAYRSSLAAAVVLGCFALNPNVLYLATTPMTEVVFLAGLAVLLFALVRFRASQRPQYITLAVLASWWMSLTRYDGWFLIPFAAFALGISSRQRRWRVLFIFCALAALAPLYWFAHNWWETGNALDFYNGPYSPAAIQGGATYPGYHNWLAAFGYYSLAGALCSGWSLALLGVLGALCAIKKRVFPPILFLCLTPLFYIWSMHSSGGTPIYLPDLWPNSYYNTRYGIAVVILAAFAAGAVVLVLPPRWKRWSWLLIFVAVVFWLLPPSRQNWICWKESQQNSISRRAWTKPAADFVRSNYQPGQGFLITSGTGDVSGILCRASIPLRETLHMGNGPAWYATTTRPDLLHGELWAIAQKGDFVDRALESSRQPVYLVEKEIHVPGAPVLRIYHRHDLGVKNP